MLLLEDKYSSLVNALQIKADDHFGLLNDTVDIIRDQLTHDLPYSGTFDFGCTRLVLICDGLSNVIKIPFNGTFYQIGRDKFIFDYFNFNSGVKADATNWFNYCEHEIQMYKQLKDRCFEDIFLKLEYLKDTPGGYPCYLQEKIYTPELHDLADKCSRSYNHAVDISESFYSADNLDLTWLTTAIDYYGADYIEDLFEFGDSEEGEDFFSDLHNLNIGYAVSDNRPLIIDYAGYQH